MAAEDGNNGAWCGDAESHCSTFITSSFCESVGWEVPEIRRLMVPVTAQTFLTANDKMLIKTLQ